MKNKKCKICGEKFTPVRQLQPTCNTYKCQIEYANRHLNKKIKEKKKEITKAKKDFYKKDVTTLKAKAQSAVNRYIRLRDKGDPCISCGCKVVKGDASHFFSVGAHSSVRFDVRNIHLSCYKCNRFLHGNLAEYCPKLIQKIGINRFKDLESLSKDQKKYSSTYYNRIIEIFNKKSKKLI